MVHEDIILDFAAIVIVGSTASGKSDLAHKLFKISQTWERPLHIVNTDAFQIYKGVDVGTAKPTLDEQKEFRYAAIDMVNPTENIDAQAFAKRINSICTGLWKSGKMPILVGGSGLYLRCLLHGLNDLPDRDDNIRGFLKGLASEKGWPHLHKVLSCMDPKRASELHPNDGVRIERAMEVCLLSGQPMSTFLEKQANLNEQECLFPAKVIHVERDNDELKGRIDLRAQIMLQTGWLEEVKGLYEKYGSSILESQAFKAIGYPEVFQTLKDHNFEIQKITQSSLAELKQKISTLTWQYAKRQKTWNSKELKHLSYFPDATNIKEIAEEVKKFQVSVDI